MKTHALVTTFLCALSGFASAERPSGGIRERVATHTRRDGASVRRTDIFHGPKHVGTSFRTNLKSGVRRWVYRGRNGRIIVQREWSPRSSGDYRYRYYETAGRPGESAAAHASIDGPSGLKVSVYRNGNVWSTSITRDSAQTVTQAELDTLVNVARGILENPPKAEKRLLERHRR